MRYLDLLFNIFTRYFIIIFKTVLLPNMKRVMLINGEHKKR